MSIIEFIPSCGCTNENSNRETYIREGVCIGSSNLPQDRLKTSFVGCLKCSKGQTVIWRCTHCYSTFQKIIIKKNK